MSGKRSVRIIKKGQPKPQQKTGPKPTSARQTAREMVQTVTNWVEELQRKRRTETLEAIKFMSKTPRPNEV